MRSRKFPKAEGPFYEVKPALRAQGAPAATDLWIYDVIGDDWCDASLTAKELCRTIAAIDTAEIVLHLCSPGGSVIDGTAIYNALVIHPARVTSVIEGWTASIATIIALAGERITMFDNTLFMVHNPSLCTCGNAQQLRADADFLDKVGSLMNAVYMKRSTKSPEELQAALDAETYLTAAQALAWGFVDEVVPASAGPAAAKLDAAVIEALGFDPLFATTGGVRAAGRTLSSENEGKLRDAASLIGEVLATVEAKAPQRAAAAAGDAVPTIDTKAWADVVTAGKRH